MSNKIEEDRVSTNHYEGVGSLWDVSTICRLESEFLELKTSCPSSFVSECNRKGWCVFSIKSKQGEGKQWYSCPKILFISSAHFPTKPLSLNCSSVAGDWTEHSWLPNLSIYVYCKWAHALSHPADMGCIWEFDIDFLTANSMFCPLMLQIS